MKIAYIILLIAVAILAPVLKERHLRKTWLRILRALHDADCPLLGSEIEKATDWSYGSVYAYLRNLERYGYIIVIPDPKAKSSMVRSKFAPTDAGRDYLQRQGKRKRRPSR